MFTKAETGDDRVRNLAAMANPPAGEQFPHRVNIQIRPEDAVGTYADFISLWHNNDCFTLDFAVMTRLPKLVSDDDDQKYVDMPARVVSRVRIPPSQVFELMKALEQQLTAWERETGQRSSPRA